MKDYFKPETKIICSNLLPHPICASFNDDSHTEILGSDDEETI